MIAVRLNSIDMVVNFFHRGLRTRGTRTAVAVHTGRTDVSISGCDLKDLGDLSDLVLNVAESCVRACLPNEWIAALNDAHQDDDDRHDQQNVDQASHRVRRDHPKEPQRQCDGQNC